MAERDHDYDDVYDHHYERGREARARPLPFWDGVLLVFGQDELADPARAGELPCL